MLNKESYFLKNAPKPHIPPKLPINLSQILADQEVIRLISRANSSLGSYKGFLMNSMNPMLLISPLISQEAVLSSKLEGTHATLDDLINFEAGKLVPVEKDEIHEVLNYRYALFYALDNMSTINDNSPSGTSKLPLSSRLIKEIHKILLSNVRGATKSPGKYKTQQNYIGGGTDLFTPLPPELTLDYIDNLEQYIHYDELDPLVQCALIHCQFEMIHPFEDGNGRIGRLLIPLFLYYTETLPFPTFYMSSFFEKDRALYLQMLRKISKENGYAAWIKYFLNGIIDQASVNTDKARRLMDLYNKYKDICLTQISSRQSITLLDAVFQQPMFRAAQIAEKISVSKGTLYNLLKEFVKNGILTTDNMPRNSTYYCAEIIKSV